MSFDVADPLCFQLWELYCNILCEKIYVPSALISNRTTELVAASATFNKLHYGKIS